MVLVAKVLVDLDHLEKSIEHFKSVIEDKKGETFDLEAKFHKRIKRQIESRLPD